MLLRAFPRERAINEQGIRLFRLDQEVNTVKPMDDSRAFSPAVITA